MLCGGPSSARRAAQVVRHLTEAEKDAAVALVPKAAGSSPTPLEQLFTRSRAKAQSHRPESARLERERAVRRAGMPALPTDSVESIMPPPPPPPPPPRAKKTLHVRVDGDDDPTARPTKGKRRAGVIVTHRESMEGLRPALATDDSDGDIRAEVVHEIEQVGLYNKL